MRKDPKQGVANVVDTEETMVEWVSDAYPVNSGFAQAGVMTLSTKPQSSRSSGGRRGKSKQSASSSAAATQGSYTPVSVPAGEEQSKVFQACLAMADQELDSALCQDPLPLLAAVIGVLSATEEEPTQPEKDKEPVRQAIYFLAERLASLIALVDPSAPTVNFLQPVPRGSARAPARTLLHDVAKGLARRVPLTKLIELDGDVRPYLAALMVAAMHKADERLIVPQGFKVREIAQEQFENMLAKTAG